MAPTPMTLSDLKSQFCCLKPFYVAHINYDMYTHESESACGL